MPHWRNGSRRQGDEQSEVLHPWGLREERVSAEPKTGGVGRLLETVEQLESLPTGSVVRSRYSEVLVRSEYRDDWYAPGDEMSTSTKFIDLPALLLWEERAKQPT